MIAFRGEVSLVADLSASIRSCLTEVNPFDLSFDRNCTAPALNSAVASTGWPLLGYFFAFNRNPFGPVSVSP